MSAPGMNLLTLECATIQKKLAQEKLYSCIFFIKITFYALSKVIYHQNHSAAVLICRCVMGYTLIKLIN